MIHESIRDLAVPIDSVQPKPGNARRHDLDDLRDSLKTHSQYRPIVVNRRTGHIVKGNGTWKAASALGWSEIAVSWVDVDDSDETRYTLADNRTAELGWMNDGQLAAVLGSMDDLAGTGYDPNDLAWLERSLEPSAIGLPPAREPNGEGPAPRPGYGESDLRQLVLVVTGAEYDQFLADLDSLARDGENVPAVVKRLVLTAAGT